VNTSRYIKNAVIDGTMLGVEDHGLLTFYIYLDYGGCGQGFGGYALDEPLKVDGRFVRRRGTAFGTEAIMRLLKVVGVSKWEDLKGKAVRADAEQSKIHRLGHYLKDEWIDLKALSEEASREE